VEEHNVMKLLRVVGPNFVAGAEYVKENGVWRCARSAPIIKWITCLPVEQAGAALKKKGWSYQWL
jgi:hypothetical protein